jgi:hypothetical protein
MPKREYPAANYCIYRSERSVCGGELGDEHVIAYGLGGDPILPAASCQKHEAVTSLIQRRVLKGNFDSLRVWLGLRSRRPKERPTTITYTAQSSDRTIQQELPPAQHPFCIAFWVYKKPELLLGNRSGNSGAAWIQMLGDPNLFPKDTEVTVPGAVDSNVTGQLLAKVAHAYAVAELGQSFRPLLLGLLNERDDKILTNALVNQLVGGTEEKQGFSDMFAGVFGSYKNGQSHRTVGVSLDEAREIVVMASHLLRIVDERR